VNDVERLLALDVRAIKIASTDLDNVPLLRKAADTGLPLIVSTGASTAEEITECVERLGTWGAGDRLALLHCVSRYPAPLEAANLRAIAVLRERFGVPCGFSDHTISTRIGAWAVAAGACLLEKHFTLDRDTPGPDHSMSLDAEGLTAYVCGVREIEVALGGGAVGMTAPEGEVRAIARRSIVAARPIRAGTVLSADLLTVKRPAGGIPPTELEALVGRHILVDVGADTTLKWDMIQ
jgi:N-acetylneuraminate synthase/N,N'-diacetyllegionaminate synthase